MQCPRLKHFVRLNYDGTVSRCGHMVNAPGFATLEEMDSSEWQKSIASNMDANIFPQECRRCNASEQVQQQSIRQFSLQEHSELSKVKADYLVVGGILDNICNSACQSCNAQHSTKIGSLNSSDYYTTNNAEKFWQLPVERIVKLDINGGEPTASPAYQALLENLPTNVKEIRVNTNGSRILPNLDKLIERGVRVTVTVSLDGIGRVHDYVRWPIKWDAFKKNLQYYASLGNAIDLNTWTTVHALNVGNLKDIIDYTLDNKIKHAWAFLEAPDVLNVKYSNHFTRTADVPEELKLYVGSEADNTVELQLWTYQQDHLRGIRLWDYYK
jgi:sulfatase maturation enzyme AslB (radical SAM superfamily)